MKANAKRISKTPKNDWADDDVRITIIPDVKAEPKIVLYDHHDQPLQRKIGF